MAFVVPSDLVAAARAGRAMEIEHLLKLVWPDAYRLAYAVIGERHAAEDAAQEACVVAYRNLPSLRSDDAFRVWFCRIVVREASAIKRRHARKLSAWLEPSVDAGVPSESSCDLWRALATLPATLREVVVLRYFEDLSSREIGAILRVPPGTVRFRLMRAMQRLRPLVGDVPVVVSPNRNAAFEVRPRAV